MRKKILIPTDFSRNAWDAIAYAADLFHKEPCDFYLLNVYDYADYATDNIMVPQLDDQLFETLKINSEKGLEKLLQRLSFRDQSLDHQFITLSQQSNLIDALREVVEIKGIDLIVMGTKGDTDALNKTFGSHTVMVMEKVRSCPVLAIPPTALYTVVEEIVFPTSFKSHYKKMEMDYLVYLAKITNAAVRIVHIIKEESLTEEQRNYKELLEECLESIEFSYHFLESEHINEAVDVFVQSRNSGMIAFINKKHTLFANLFTKPMVKELGMHARVPVLALHDHHD
jgi:nucleotide-binding universal stress UspA family protein